MSGVRYIKFVTRDMVRAEPEAIFVFGDNTERRGRGGQAGAMRGEPNALGVVTKWAPGMDRDDFFRDSDACFSLVKDDLRNVQIAIAAGRTVYVPADGLGTGLSQLPTRAPRLLNHIIEFFKALPGEPCPWQLVKLEG